jgi:hypothetical protein
MGISCINDIHELGHSRISIRCKYIEIGVGLYCTSFLFHSRFEGSMSVNEADYFIVCLSRDHFHSRTASKLVLTPLIRFLLGCLEESPVTLKLT